MREDERIEDGMFSYLSFESPTGVADHREMKLWAPHPRHVLVFVARVGSSNCPLFC